MTTITKENYFKINVWFIKINSAKYLTILFQSCLDMSNINVSKLIYFFFQIEIHNSDIKERYKWINRVLTVFDSYV